MGSDSDPESVTEDCCTESTDSDGPQKNYKHLVSYKTSIRILGGVNVVERYPDKGRTSKDWIATTQKVIADLSEQGAVKTADGKNKHQNQIRRVERKRVTSHIELHVSKDVDCGKLSSWIEQLNEKLLPDMPITKVLFSYGKKSQPYHHIKLQLGSYSSTWSSESEEIQRVWLIIDDMELVSDRRVYYQLGAKARIYEKGTTIEKLIHELNQRKNGGSILQQPSGEQFPYPVNQPPSSNIPMSHFGNYGIVPGMPAVGPMSNRMFRPFDPMQPFPGMTPDVPYYPTMEGLPMSMMPSMEPTIGDNIKDGTGESNKRKHSKATRGAWDALIEKPQQYIPGIPQKPDLKTLNIQQLEDIYRNSLLRLRPTHKYTTSLVPSEKLPSEKLHSEKQHSEMADLDSILTSIGGLWGVDETNEQSNLVVGNQTFDWNASAPSDILVNKTETTETHDQIPSPPATFMSAPEPPSNPIPVRSSAGTLTTTLKDGSHISKVGLLIKAIDAGATVVTPYVKIAETLKNPNDNITLGDGSKMTKTQLYTKAVYLDDACVAAYNGLGECLKEGETVFIDEREFTRQQLYAKAIMLAVDKKIKALSYVNLANTLTSSVEDYEIGSRRLTKEELFKEAISLDEKCSEALMGLAMCAF